MLLTFGILQKYEEFLFLNINQKLSKLFRNQKVNLKLTNFEK
jgi:hypothetical protein